MTLNGFPESESPPEVVDLFEKARSGLIDRAEFSRQLEEQGISGFRKMLYIGRAFGLTLNEVKEMHIKEQYGSHEDWLEEVGLTDPDTLEEIGKSDYSKSE